MMETICVCGGGSLGHVTAGYLAAKGYSVNVLTRRPADWGSELEILTPGGTKLKGHIALVTDKEEQAVNGADVVLLCLPGYAIEQELQRLKPHLQKSTFVGSVFSSSGFFFQANRILGSEYPLWGFQRVPFISRVSEYGHRANLLGYKDSFNIAVENTDKKEEFRKFVEEAFGRPTHLLANYLEASLTNSNPILHTGRLFSMFHDWHEGMTYPRNFLFYEEWTDEASELLIKMDEEFFRLLERLPVTKGFLPTLLNYYESSDASSLTRKIQSIESFKGIKSPMKEVENGWVPDFASRYFTEDFLYGLGHIRQLAHERLLEVPCIDKVYQWGAAKTV